MRFVKKIRRENVLGILFDCEFNTKGKNVYREE